MNNKLEMSMNFRIKLLKILMEQFELVTSIYLFHFNPKISNYKYRYKTDFNLNYYNTDKD